MVDDGKRGRETRNKQNNKVKQDRKRQRYGQTDKGMGQYTFRQTYGQRQGQKSMYRKTLRQRCGLKNADRQRFGQRDRDLKRYTVRKRDKDMGRNIHKEIKTLKRNI